MKITIIGTGGVGGYFGGRLAKAGNDVTFVARGQHLKALQKTGLTVKSIQGDFHIHPVQATDAVAKTTPADLVIIATKAWQVKDIAHQLLPVIGSNTLVLPLQNGVLSSEELREILPHSNVLSGLCRIISKIEAPGVINHLAVEPTLIFGEYNNCKSERLVPVQATLQKAGFKAFIADDIQAERWKKFISICASGWLAVTGGTYGEVCQQPETHAILHQLYAEVAEVARALGINIAVGFEDKLMAATEAFPFNSTASLTRDVWEGKPSEIEYQNGTVVRLAQKAGIKVPINQFIYHSLLIKEHKARDHKTTD
jgi:2-dehydropantoate 2-reductase